MSRGKILDADGQELPNGDLPIWARILFRYGIVGALTLYLVFQLTQGFGATLNAIRDEQRVHIVYTNFFLRQVCMNTAKDDTQRALCVPPDERK